jgi:hypothetical protein
MARGRVPAGLVLVFLVPALAACGAEPAGPSGSPARPDVTSGPTAEPTPPRGGALTFDDGSPGRLTAVRASDGTTTVSLEVDSTGAPVTRIALSAANEAADVTGLEVSMSGSDGAWAGQVLLPLAGTWTFEVSVQRNDAGFLTEDLADASVEL